MSVSLNLGESITAQRVPMPEYERSGIVGEWLSAYVLEKERQFIKCINRFVPETNKTLLDVGCGTGLHTSLWSEMGKQVTAADFSTQFRDHIQRTYNFPFMWLDVLNGSIEGTYDICFCMAITTILLDEDQRFRTFARLASILHPGSCLVLVT